MKGKTEGVRKLWDKYKFVGLTVLIGVGLLLWPSGRKTTDASGSSPVNMIQAVFYNEDMLIYDLEDSVPAAEKDAARFLVYNMVKNHRPKDKYVCILYSYFSYSGFNNYIFIFY